ncbi:MAG: hypothetical protein HZA24_06355 [Nitrospirae bacterium]|nr:hypothetical protein [Nitrospirota bacterium]
MRLAVAAVLCVALLPGCQSAPVQGAPVPDAASGTVDAQVGKTAKAPARSDARAVLEGAGGQVWRATASGELSFAEAAAFCRELPAHQGSAWRLPSFYELARGPLGGIKLPEGGRLWSDTAPESLPLQRLVVDPQNPFARAGVDLREGPRFHALCVAAPAP